MFKQQIVKRILKIEMMVFAILFLVNQVHAEPIDPKEVLPKMMFITVYDVGSQGFNQASAVADALTKKYGLQIRLIPGTTGFSRLGPVKQGTAHYALAADEVFFCSEGMFEFSSMDQGPADFRVLLGPPQCVTFITAKDAGIKTVADVRGKRVAYVPGSSTIIIKTTGYLAFGGLTWKDVIPTPMPSYNAYVKGLIEGTVDAAQGGPDHSGIYELASSRRGVWYPLFKASDKEAWKRMNDWMPSLFPGLEDKGAGLTPGKPLELTLFKYPQIVTTASRDEKEVYAMVKAIDESYGLYKNALPLMAKWSIDLSGKTPAGIPFHKGAVRYLKEKGVWTDDDEKWNKERTERIEKVITAWKQVKEEAIAKKVKPSDFPRFWLERKKEMIGGYCKEIPAEVK